MTHKQGNIDRQKLQTSIILSAIFISVALLFLGYKISNTSQSATIDDSVIEQKIQAGIESYIAKQQAEYEKQQAKQIVPDAPVVDNISIDDDPILGDPDAPVTIVEFSDYECPFCKRYYTQTYPEIKKNYVDKGLVKIVYRDYPLSFHDPLSTQESMAAECVQELGGDEVYFKYHDLIFDTTTSNGRGMEKSKLYELAAQVGVNASKFKNCLDSEKYKDEVQNDIREGQKYGVSGTPGFFINGRSLKGAQPYAQFESIIEEELAK